MNNVILRTVTLDGQWQPLSAEPLVGTVTVSTPPANTDSVLFRTRAEPAMTVAWIPGEWHAFTRIDLSEVEVSAPAGNTVTIVGGTW